MVKAGVFTPWAQILCVACNNALVAQGDARAREMKTPEVEGQHNATCDTCGIDVRVPRDDVAVCQRFARETGMELWQTGGMCVAAGFAAAGREILVTVDEDGLPDDENVGRLCTLDMGKRGARPRTVTCRVIGCQRIFDGSKAYRVEIVEDPCYPEFSGATMPARPGEIAWL